MITNSLVLLSASLALVAAAPTYRVPPKHTNVVARISQPGGGRTYNSYVHELLTAPRPAHVSRRGAGLNKLVPGFKRDPGHDEEGHDEEEGEDCEDDGGDMPPTTDPTTPPEDDGECEGEGEGDGDGDVPPTEPPSEPPSEGGDDGECDSDGDVPPTEPPTEPPAPPEGGGDDDDCEDDDEPTTPPSPGDDEDCEDDDDGGDDDGDDEDCDEEGGSGSVPPTTPSEPGSGSCSQEYTVKGGDYCAKVAEDHNISLADFFMWNPDLDAQCMNLHIGQSYCVGM